MKHFGILFIHFTAVFGSLWTPSVLIDDKRYFKDLTERSCNSCERFESLKSDRYNDCQKSILKPLLQVCTQQGVDGIPSDTKMIISIQMAVCDYNAANATYPDCCQYSDNSAFSLNKCLSELIKSPSLYTAYHSYLLSLASICKEESLPYEKDQVIELFASLTEIVDGVVADFEDVLQLADLHLSSFQDEMVLMRLQVKDFVGRELENIRVQSNETINNISKDFTNSMLEMMQNVTRSNLANDQLLKNVTLQNLEEITSSLSDAKLLSNLTDIYNFYNTMLSLTLENVTAISVHLFETGSKTLNSYNDRILSVNAMMDQQMLKAQSMVSETAKLSELRRQMYLSEQESIERLLSGVKLELGEYVDEIFVSMNDIHSRIDQVVPNLSGFLQRTSLISVVKRAMSYNFIILVLVFLVIASLSFSFLFQKANKLAISSELGLIANLRMLLIYSIGAIAFFFGLVSSRFVFS